MRKFPRTLWKAAIAVGMTPLVASAFAALVAASLLIPNGPIARNIVKDLDIVVRERADNGRSVDSLTECTGMSFGLRYNPEEGEHPLAAAARAPTVIGCGSLSAFLNGEQGIGEKDYFRYWHGYSVLTRPVLYALPYNDLRQHLFNVSIVLTGVFLWRIGADFGPRVALAFAVPFFVLNAFAYWIVATKAVTWYLMIGGAIWVSRRKSREAPLLFFFALGALTAFLDFLTAPAAVFATSALTYALYAARSETPVTISTAGWLFCFFGIGYAGLWAAKLSLADMFLETDVWGDALAAALIRLRGADPNIDSLAPGAAIWSNIERLKDFWAPVALILFVLTPIATRRGRAALASIWASGRPMLAIAATPLLWLEALSNHSQIHAHFTQLNFTPIFTLLMLAALGETRFLGPSARLSGHRSHLAAQEAT